MAIAPPSRADSGLNVAAALHSASNLRIRQRYLDLEKGQIYYWTAGSGPDLLLVHQSGNSSEEYAGMVPYLADRFRLIAFDLPGHGRSDDPPEQATVEDFAYAARRLLDHLGVRKAHVLGHHGGALTAMSLLASEPDRFEKAILSGTSGVRSREENEEFIAAFRNFDSSIGGDGEFMANIWDRYMELRSDGAEPVDVLKPFISSLQSRIRPYRGVITNLSWDRRPALAKLRGPVLLVQGDKDGYVSRQEQLLKVIPNSTRTVLPGFGTFMFYEKPKECAELISDYLST